MPHDECKHHWLLNDTSFGVCKLCGDEKQFPRPGDIDELDIWRGHHPGKKEKQVVDDGVDSTEFEKGSSAPRVGNGGALAAALAMVEANPQLTITHIARVCKVPNSTLYYRVWVNNLRPKRESEAGAAVNQAPAPFTATCPVCGKSGIGVRGLASHIYFKHQMAKGHRLDGKPSEVPVAPEGKSFECPYCSNTYPTGKALGPHIRFKHPEKIFERRFGTKIVPLADKEAALLATADHIGRLIDALDIQKAKLIDLLTLTMQGVIGPLPGTIK